MMTRRKSLIQKQGARTSLITLVFSGIVKCGDKTRTHQSETKELQRHRYDLSLLMRLYIVCY